MIIWSGWGILVPVVPIIIWFLILLFFQAILPADTYSSYNKLFSDLGMLLGGLALWFLGKRLNSAEVRTLFDEKAGERVFLKTNHSFFFIKMQYWAIIIPLLYWAVVHVDL